MAVQFGFFLMVKYTLDIAAQETGYTMSQSIMLNNIGSLYRSQSKYSEALAYFEAKGHTDKIKLLKTRKKDYLTLYTLAGAKDYYHGYMVPSTGYLREFALQPYGPGFVLQYPRRERPSVIQKPVEYPKLVAVFNEYREWMDLMGIPNVGALNEANEAGRRFHIRATHSSTPGARSRMIRAGAGSQEK